MVYKIGDRYEWTGVRKKEYIYLHECVGDELMEVLEAGYGSGWKIGDRTTWKPSEVTTGWKFIGNFSKDRNVTNLYKLLSNEA